MKTNFFISKAAARKLIVFLILGGSAIGAFATLGDGKIGKDKSRNSLLSAKTRTTPGTFSLQSGYSFRGNQVIDFEQNKYINLNTVVTYQQGNTTYTLPSKKKVILNNKVTFNPNAATRH